MFYILIFFSSIILLIGISEQSPKIPPKENKPKLKKYPFPEYVEPPPDAPISQAERLANRAKYDNRTSLYDTLGYDYVAKQEELEKQHLKIKQELKKAEEECESWAFPVRIITPEKDN